MVRKGFTLVELMIVILIVAILAAVAIPLMTGRIDAAKWSEARSAMGTIGTAIRAYYAEKGCGTPAPTTPSMDPTSGGFVGVTANDLDGTYFSSACYGITTASCTPATGKVNFVVTCTAASSLRVNTRPTTPAQIWLVCVDNVASFSDTAP